MTDKSKSNRIDPNNTIIENKLLNKSKICQVTDGSRSDHNRNFRLTNQLLKEDISLVTNYNYTIIEDKPLVEAKTHQMTNKSRLNPTDSDDIIVESEHLDRI